MRRRVSTDTTSEARPIALPDLPKNDGESMSRPKSPEADAKTQRQREANRRNYSKTGSKWSQLSDEEKEKRRLAAREWKRKNKEKLKAEQSVSTPGADATKCRPDLAAAPRAQDRSRGSEAQDPGHRNEAGCRAYQRSPVLTPGECLQDLWKLFSAIQKPMLVLF